MNHNDIIISLIWITMILLYTMIQITPLSFYPIIQSLWCKVQRYHYTLYELGVLHHYHNDMIIKQYIGENFVLCMIFLVKNYGDDAKKKKSD